MWFTRSRASGGKAASAPLSVVVAELQQRGDGREPFRSGRRAAGVSRADVGRGQSCQQAGGDSERHRSVAEHLDQI